MGTSKKRIDLSITATKFIEIALWVLFVFGFIIAFEFNTWVLALVGGIINLSIYYVAKWAFKNSKVVQYFAALCFGIFMAQFIYQFHGLFEMHFFAFLGSAILISYQNWKAQIPLILFIVVHHAIFGYLQYLGNGDVYFTQLEYMSLKTFIYHGALAASLVAVNGFWSHKFYQSSEIEKADNMVLSTKVEHYIKLAKMIAEMDKTDKTSFTNEVGAFDKEDPVQLALVNMADEISKQQSKLTQNNNELNSLVYALSHDLKTPIRGINSVAEWIESDYKDDKLSDIPKHLSLLKTNAKSIWEKLESLKMYLSIGLHKNEYSKFKLEILLHELTNHLKEEKLNFKFITDIEKEVYSSRGLLKIILHQLIENSVVHSNKDIPEIKILIDPASTSNKTVIQYSDDGPGITEEEFFRFSKLFQTASKDYNNLRAGIGLPLVVKTMTELNGQIDYVNSNSGLVLKLSFPSK